MYGYRITGIEKGGPAEKIGLKRRDVIFQLDCVGGACVGYKFEHNSLWYKDIHSLKKVDALVDTAPRGHYIKLQFFRPTEGDARFPGHTVYDRHHRTIRDISESMVARNKGYSERFAQLLGAQIEDNQEGGGFLVGRIVKNGPAYEAGLRSGDIIVGVGIYVADGGLESLAKHAEATMFRNGSMTVYAQVNVKPSRGSIAPAAPNRRTFKVLSQSGRFESSDFAFAPRERRQDRSSVPVYLSQQEKTKAFLDSDDLVARRLRLFDKGDFSQLTRLLRWLCSAIS